MEHVGKLIEALSALGERRKAERGFAEGIWLLSVETLAIALAVEASAWHHLWLEDLGQLPLYPGPDDYDVVAEVRRVVLGEEVPHHGITMPEVLARMGLLAMPDGGGAG